MSEKPFSFVITVDSEGKISTNMPTLSVEDLRGFYRATGEYLVENRFMTEEDAEHQRGVLTTYWQQPVLKMRTYCDAFRKWAHAIEAMHASKEPRYEGEDPKHRHGSEYVQSLHRMLIDISKSNLLGRLLYGGEQFRTRPCPEHKGRWSGLEFDDMRCKHGCGLTGWLPEDDDPVHAPTREYDAIIKALPCMDHEEAIAVANAMPEEELTVDQILAHGLYARAGIGRDPEASTPEKPVYKPIWIVYYRRKDRDWCISSTNVARPRKHSISYRW